MSLNSQRIDLHEECVDNAPNPSELSKAGERTRTVNIQLGRLTLYQLSYARETALAYAEPSYRST